MYELSIEARFSAAHRLRDYEGDCEKLHGHNWLLRVTVESGQLNRLGMVMDFRDLKARVRDILKEFDHAYLNDLERFGRENPTTENLARFVCEEVARRLPEGVRLKDVTAWETPGCGATYRP